MTVIDKGDPLVVTVKRAAELTGLGNTTLYRLIKENRLEVRRVPGVDRTLISYRSSQELLTPNPSENTKTPPPRRPRGRPQKHAPSHRHAARGAYSCTKCARRLRWCHRAPDTTRYLPNS
jgi:excisionase family DNA binding protein